MAEPLTPLRVRSGYSLLRGTALPERLVERAGELGYGRMALTDVNGLYGATRFYAAAREAGLEPITGAELRAGRHSAVALVENDAGYENLCRLVTRACRPEGFDLPADLPGLSAGLHVVVEDDELAAALRRGGLDGQRLWLEIDPATQTDWQLRRLAGCGSRLGLPLVATGKALLASADDIETARLLAAIRLGGNYDAVADDALPHRQAHLRDPDDLRRQLAAFPDAVRNNRRLAERCRYALLPRRRVFPVFPAPDGSPPAAYLRRLCRQGMRRRYGAIPPEIAECRLSRELRLIDRMGFSEYFLVVWDIVQYARGRGAPVAGRGSGASSLVAYLLGITNVCPIAFDIPFERFLHEGREDFPDLDVDFCWRIRDEVIDYAFRRWGGDRVAMVSMHTTFQPASAVRETAKALGVSDEQITRLAAGEWAEPAGPGEGGGEAPPPQSPRIAIRGLSTDRTRGSSTGGARGVSQTADRGVSMDAIRGLSRRIMGLPHGLSVHPGGIVIAPTAIDRYAPVQEAAKRIASPLHPRELRPVRITQYDKDGVKDAGLVKLDLLGNRNLSTVRAACELLRQRQVTIDPDSLPPADPATIRTLRSAGTVGCNQLESPAMRNLLAMLAPSHVRDVMKALALIRPGAASVGMKEVFVRRHRRLEAPPAGHPQADAILRDTYGVMLYEDDVMLVAAALLGGSLSEGDRFRKAVQKCRDDGQRLELSRQFLARCRREGVDGEYAKDVWVQMAKFNAYSFCRAHAASYAVLAYAGAYLKTHHPLAFWTAALNNNQSMYHRRVYVEQAKRVGIRFLGPHVNRSEAEFGIDRPGGGEPAGAEGIRVGLGGLAGLGPAGVAGILEARASGPFAGLTDLLARTGLGREPARALVLCGAFDATGRRRPELMIELDLFFGPGGRRVSRAATLLPASPVVPGLGGDYPEPRKYADQWRILGFSLGEHVMARYRRRLAGAVDADSRHLAGRVGRRVRIAGVLEAHRTTPARRGGTVRFLTLDDEHGLFEATVLPGVMPAGGQAGLGRYGPYVVTGEVESQYGAVTISARRVSLYRPAVAAEAS